jgi:hypothetical protein
LREHQCAESGSSRFAEMLVGIDCRLGSTQSQSIGQSHDGGGVSPQSEAATGLPGGDPERLLSLMGVMTLPDPQKVTTGILTQKKGHPEQGSDPKLT